MSVATAAKNSCQPQKRKIIDSDFLGDVLNQCTSSKRTRVLKGSSKMQESLHDNDPSRKSRRRSNSQQIESPKTNIQKENKSNTEDSPKGLNAHLKTDTSKILLGSKSHKDISDTRDKQERKSSKDHFVKEHSSSKNVDSSRDLSVHRREKSKNASVSSHISPLKASKLPTTATTKSTSHISPKKVGSTSHKNPSKAKRSFECTKDARPLSSLSELFSPPRKTLRSSSRNSPKMKDCKEISSQLKSPCKSTKTGGGMPISSVTTQKAHCGGKSSKDKRRSIDDKKFRSQLFTCDENHDPSSKYLENKSPKKDIARKDKTRSPQKKASKANILLPKESERTKDIVNKQNASKLYSYDKNDHKQNDSSYSKQASPNESISSSPKKSKHLRSEKSPKESTAQNSALKVSIPQRSSPKKSPQTNVPRREHRSSSRSIKSDETSGAEDLQRNSKNVETNTPESQPCKTSPKKHNRTTSEKNNDPSKQLNPSSNSKNDYPISKNKTYSSRKYDELFEEPPPKSDTGTFRRYSQSSNKNIVKAKPVSSKTHKTFNESRRDTGEISLKIKRRSLDCDFKARDYPSSCPKKLRLTSPLKKDSLETRSLSSREKVKKMEPSFNKFSLKEKWGELSQGYEKLQVEDALKLLYKPKKSPFYASTDSGKGSTRSTTPNYFSEDSESKTMNIIPAYSKSVGLTELNFKRDDAPLELTFVKEKPPQSNSYTSRIAKSFASVMSVMEKKARNLTSKNTSIPPKSNLTSQSNYSHSYELEQMIHETLHKSTLKRFHHPFKLTKKPNAVQEEKVSPDRKKNSVQTSKEVLKSGRHSQEHLQRPSIPSTNTKNKPPPSLTTRVPSEKLRRGSAQSHISVPNPYGKVPLHRSKSTQELQRSSESSQGLNFGPENRSASSLDLKSKMVSSLATGKSRVDVKQPQGPAANQSLKTEEPHINNAKTSIKGLDEKLTPSIKNMISSKIDPKAVCQNTSKPSVLKSNPSSTKQTRETPLLNRVPSSLDNRSLNTHEKQKPKNSSPLTSQKQKILIDDQKRVVDTDKSSDMKRPANELSKCTDKFQDKPLEVHVKPSEKLLKPHPKSSTPPSDKPMSHNLKNTVTYPKGSNSNRLSSDMKKKKPVSANELPASKFTEAKLHQQCQATVESCKNPPKLPNPHNDKPIPHNLRYPCTHPKGSTPYRLSSDMKDKIAPRSELPKSTEASLHHKTLVESNKKPTVPSSKPYNPSSSKPISHSLKPLCTDSNRPSSGPNDISTNKLPASSSVLPSKSQSLDKSSKKPPHKPPPKLAGYSSSSVKKLMAFMDPTPTKFSFAKRPSPTSSSLPSSLPKRHPIIPRRKKPLEAPKYFFKVQLGAKTTSSGSVSSVERLSDSEGDENNSKDIEEILVPRLEPLPGLLPRIPSTPNRSEDNGDSSSSESSSDSDSDDSSCSSSCSTCSSSSSSDSDSSSSSSDSESD